MDRSNQKLRFQIAPGDVARIAERESQESGAVPPVMRIKGGTAARMSEAEAPVSVRSPYGISMRAATGRPFTLADERNADARKPASEDDDLLSNQALSNAAVGGSIQKTSFRPVTQHDKVSGSVENAPLFEEEHSGRGEKETQVQARSPLQAIRALFSRTLPKTVAHDEE